MEKKEHQEFQMQTNRLTGSIFIPNVEWFGKSFEAAGKEHMHDKS